MEVHLTPMQLFGLHTTRDLTIKNFKGLGTLDIPKGTTIIPAQRTTDANASWITGDLYLTPTAVFYGVSVPADSVADTMTQPTELIAPE